MRVSLVRPGGDGQALSPLTTNKFAASRIAGQPEYYFRRVDYSRWEYLIYRSKVQPVLRFYCGRLRAERDRACAGRFSAFDLCQTWLYHRFLLTCISPSPARVHDDCQRPFEGRCFHHNPGTTPAGDLFPPIPARSALSGCHSSLRISRWLYFC